MRVVFVTVLSIVFLIGLGFTLDYAGLQWFRFIEPQKEDARHEVFKKTRAYNEAKLQELVKLKYEYERADKAGKEAIANVIRHTFAEYDENQLPEELKKFVKKIKYGGQ